MLKKKRKRSLGGMVQSNAIQQVPKKVFLLFSSYNTSHCYKSYHCLRNNFKSFLYTYLKESALAIISKWRRKI